MNVVGGGVPDAPRNERRREHPGGMNLSPTGGTLTGFDVKLRRGQDPSLRCKPLKGIQWQGCGPGMPGPYGVTQMGGSREGQGRAAARPFAVGGWLPVDGLPR